MQQDEVANTARHKPHFDDRRVDTRLIPEKWLNDVHFFDHIQSVSGVCTWQCGVCFQRWDSNAKLPCPRCRPNWKDELAVLSRAAQPEPAETPAELPPERIWMSYDPELDVWFQSSEPPRCYKDVGITEPPTLYVRADLASPRAVRSRLIHLAAALLLHRGFLSPDLEDNPASKRVLKIAEAQNEQLRVWAVEIREIADSLASRDAAAGENK